MVPLRHRAERTYDYFVPKNQLINEWNQWCNKMRRQLSLMFEIVYLACEIFLTLMNADDLFFMTPLPEST